MKRFRQFIQTTLLGGIVVVLPAVILVLVGRWLVAALGDAVQPLTPLLGPAYNRYEVVAHLIILSLILVACFLIGLGVRTQLGSMIVNTLERRVLKIAPGYSLIRETVVQLLGHERPPFSQAVLARPFGNDTKVFAFVTDSHDDGSYTIFVPTGPNPTSGFIFHVPPEVVDPLDVPLEKVMRSIISAGAGSRELLTAYKDQAERKTAANEETPPTAASSPPNVPRS